MRTERAAVVLVGGLLALVGCTRDMKDQPKHKAYSSSDFYADGASARPLPPGTVPRGFLREDRTLYAGLGNDGKFTTTLPVPATAELLARGRERYEIFCSPCHDRTGGGRGMIVRRGFKQPPSFHIDRLRGARPGYIFDVITNGFGEMSGYASQVHPQDRWAIVAYLRVLQLSQHVELGLLPQSQRARIEQAIAADGAPAAAPSAGGHPPGEH